jgi:hypothetical protein
MVGTAPILRRSALAKEPEPRTVGHHNRGTQKQGFTSIGKVTINKQKETKKFEARTGFFIEKNNPK